MVDDGNIILKVLRGKRRARALSSYNVLVYEAWIFWELNLQVGSRNLVHPACAPRGHLSTHASEATS